MPTVRARHRLGFRRSLNQIARPHRDGPSTAGNPRSRFTARRLRSPGPWMAPRPRTVPIGLQRKLRDHFFVRRHIIVGTLGPTRESAAGECGIALDGDWRWRVTFWTKLFAGNPTSPRMRTSDGTGRVLEHCARATPDGVAVPRRRAQPGRSQATSAAIWPNALKAGSQTTALGLFLSQFKSPLVLILIFAAIVSAHRGGVDRCQHRAGRGAWQHDARLRAGIPCQQRRRETTFTGHDQIQRAAWRSAADCCPPNKWCQAMWCCSLRAA